MQIFLGHALRNLDGLTGYVRCEEEKAVAKVGNGPRGLFPCCWPINQGELACKEGTRWKEKRRELARNAVRAHAAHAREHRKSGTIVRVSRTQPYMTRSVAVARQPATR